MQHERFTAAARRTTAPRGARRHTMEKLFKPQFAYTLGRGDDAIAKQWQHLTEADLDVAAEGIENGEHAAEFVRFVGGYREKLADGATLGEAVARHAAELRQRAADAFGHADELEAHARATGRGW